MASEKKSANTTNTTPPKAKGKSGSATASKEPGLSIFSDRRFPIVAGIILLLWSFFLAIALASFISSAATDDSIVTKTQVTEAQAEEAQNLLGSMGALVGAFFFNKLFGFGSFLFIIQFFTLGVNALLRRKLFKMGKIVLFSSLLIIGLSFWGSYLQNFIDPAGVLLWGGAFGDFLFGQEGILMHQLKPIGCGMLLLGSTLIAAVIIFNFSFDFIAHFLDKLKQNNLEKQERLKQEQERQVPLVTESIFEKEGIPTPETKTETQEEADTSTPNYWAHTKPADEQELEGSLDFEVKYADEAYEETSNSTEEAIIPPTSETPTHSTVQTWDFNQKISPIENKISSEIDTPLEIKPSFESEEPTVTTTPKWEAEEAVEEAEEWKEMAEFDSLVNSKGEYDPTLGLSLYKSPGIELLEEHGSEKIKIDPAELEKNKQQIIQTLNNYKIDISKIMATIGPTVTLYEIVPAPGVRISKIKSLEDDIALSLSALGIRIIAPIPGKGTIGIEVPNVNKEIVSMKSMIASEKFRNTSMELPVCLGKTISNEIYIADLAKMPHLLMAGATGQGKSVGINSILVSLLYKKHPAELKFVLVDPKKVELSIYSAIENHYLAKLPGEEDAIITDTRKVVSTLQALCIEMDMRYDLLKKANVRNLKEYNVKFCNRKLNPHNGHRFLPLIVVVVDEFADLIMTAGKEVEMPIARLAQLARAIGIHLILATQRPSVNIITGTIKANFPARISFKVASKIDSRTILDMGGAEQLIGRGDMLLSLGSDLIRLQCGFVDTPEVDRIVQHIYKQQGFPVPFLLPEVLDEGNAEGGAKGSFDSSQRDELFEEAARIIVQNQMGSTSLIQRRLKLGYNRAGRLMDQLEEAGIVGPNLGSKAREVLFSNEMELEDYLRKLF